MAKILLGAATVLALATSVQGQCTTIPMCECSTMTSTITCSRVGSSLANILPNIPSSTSKLHITGLSIYALSEQVFEDMGTNYINELRIIEGQVNDIGNMAFKKFPAIQTLGLAHNQISSISSQAFTGIGNLQTLDLSNNRLGTTFSSSDVFQMVIKLRQLDLSHNQLQDLPAGLLDPLRSLHTLNLNENRISNLKGSSFNGAAGIRNLQLSKNNLRSIDEDFFSKVSMLDTLDLSYNGLTAVPGNGKLNLLRHLRNLTLQGNAITALQDGTFQGLNLDVLDLSRNRLATLTQNTFMYLGSVRHLDLSYNQLGRLTDYVFQPIASQLFSLKLNNNRGLVSLPDNLFQGMQMLQDLDLSFCGLTELYYGGFASIFSLQKVDVSNNMLTALPEAFLSKANQMSSVHITNNPWVCDCFIKPLRDWLRLPRSSSVLVCASNTPAAIGRNCMSEKCTAPQKLLYRDIYTLQDQEIPPCENLAESTSGSMEIIIGVIVGVLVCIIVIIILLVCLYRRHKNGDPLLCGDNDSKKKKKKRKKKSPKKDEVFRDRKEKRPNIDPDAGSLNESDKGFVVRNYFHSMEPDNDEASMGTQSMTRRGSQESLSHSGYAYGSRAGSRTSSQYSLNSGYRIESAV